MIGLEKVTDRIIAEANAEAQKMFDEAQAKVDVINAQTDEKIAALRAETENEIATEAENIISRAKSQADMQNRNIVLEQKCKSLDEVFVNAEKKICAMPENEYLAFVVSNASRAVEAEEKSTECVLTFNEKDTKSCAETAIKLFAHMFPGKSFRLSCRTADISGGVLIDFGQTDVDCSVKAILTEIRPSIEIQLCQLLFESTKKNEKN